MRSLIPLALFLLGCAGIYVGTVQAAFSALMRLPMRLSAERTGAGDALASYLEEPRLLFIPARTILGVVLILACELTSMLFGVGTFRSLGVLALAAVGFVVVCEHLVPQLIARRNPQAVLQFLLPSFRVLASPLQPLTLALLGVSGRTRDTAPGELNLLPERNGGNGATADKTETAEQGDERRMLQSIVDFGEILVREIMTPRPDIVAIRSDAMLAELHALFREQQYSRVPVFNENLDNIVGIVFVKDLLLLHDPAGEAQPVTTLMRPAVFVPETKRVAELLREFQRRQLQACVVVDEYGGTAGFVTIEDMLEEIVGEIRDEYDVETEPIVDEADGAFVFSAKVDIDQAAERLDVSIEREGFETVGGFIVSRLGRVPAPGERFTIEDIGVEVLEAERRRVHKVRMRKVDLPPNVMRQGA
jgi:CBS domain containing-hemolysin-like protein